MSSKTFYLAAPVNAQAIEVSGVSRPGLHSVVITTTDGLIPSGGTLSGNTRSFNSAYGTNNIDWGNSYVKFFDGNYQSKYQTSNIVSVPLLDFSFDVRHLTQDAGGDSWSLTSDIDLYLGFSNGFIHLQAGGFLRYSKPQSNAAYNFVDWGGNGSGAAAGNGWSELNSLKFRTEDNLNAYLLSQELVRVINYTELNTTQYVETLSGRALFNGRLYYEMNTNARRYAEEFTVSSPVTIDQLSIFGATEWTPSGTLTYEIHSVGVSDLVNTPDRVPEATVSVPLTSSSVIATSDTDWGYAVFGKLANPVTLQAGTYTFVAKITAGSVLKIAVISKSGSNLRYGSTAYDLTYTNQSLPFLLSTVTASNTAPTGISLSANSIAEDAGANAVVGTLSATDAEGGVMTWSLVAGTGDNDNASFEIVGDELRLANGVSLDYEAKSSYAIRVQATDAGGLSFSGPLVINVSNVNEAPSNITLSAASIQEGNAIGDVIGTLAAIDPDTGDTSFVFSILAGGDKFSIEGGSLKAAAVFDYEVATSHSVTIRATDAGGASFDKVFSISVLNDSSDDPQAVSGDQVVSGTGGKIALTSANNPTVSEFTLNGQALAKGSVVRWAGNNNQKFLKIAGDSKAFKAIPLAPPVSWKWDAAGDDAWEVLQGF